MSYIERRIDTRPVRGEAQFKLKEVFFSRTDDRGVIQAGNHIFAEVSNYPWSELHGAPHKLIRHPDMPKGVFWLFWDTLKRGKSIGAYVKNQTKDGLYYWVFSMAMPCEGGYLSARIKPTSSTFAIIEEEYATLLKAEQEENLSPEDSAKRLLARLNELGFPDYPTFAAHALSQELIARDTGLNRKPDQGISDSLSMLSNAEELTQETDALVQEFEAMRTIPHNLRVIASRIEPAGGPVTVLSQNYGTMSREMSEWFERNVLGENSNFSVIKGTISHSMFVQCVARILEECDSHIKTERRSMDGVDMDRERAVLGKLIARQNLQADDGLKEVSVEAQRILSACEVMHRHFLGLSSTRVLCKIESARLSTEGDALTAIIDQLGVFQERISAQLGHIAQLSTEIRARDH
ncbi:PAS domain-containing protein [Parasedimentitalea maritima]|uniref:PAS domain-containing protein n=1 Tax=Parasedimentitalea maritima TaxID=2578117 RepID=A0A6A4RCI9_9RHOB|nr:PAS domain-containing protein [Zongyanglinia marina]KAE9627845.1 PAS domain-containing protein [Zongyanglinia marina]